MSRTLIPLKDVPIGSTVIDRETKYYGAPIEWTVIGQNHADDHAQHHDKNVTTIQTKHIIASKAFDASERYLKGYTAELTDHFVSGERYFILYTNASSSDTSEKKYTNTGILYALSNTGAIETTFNSSIIDNRLGINFSTLDVKAQAMWTVEEVNPGIYTFKNSDNEKYLSNNNGSVGVSSYVGNNSKWKLTSKSESGYNLTVLTSYARQDRFIRCSNGQSKFIFGNMSSPTDGVNANIYIYKINEYSSNFVTDVSGRMITIEENGDLVIIGEKTGADTNIVFPSHINDVNYKGLRIEYELSGPTHSFALKYHKLGDPDDTYYWDSSNENYFFNPSSTIKDFSLNTSYLPIDKLVIFDNPNTDPARLKIHKIIFYGSQTHASEVPTFYGNSLFSTSNITGWLNNFGDWFVKRDYKDRPPARDNLLNGYNAYYNEPGFMSNISTMLKRNMLETSKSGYEYGKYIFMLSDVELYSSSGYEYFTSNDRRKKTRTQECIDNSDSGADVYWTRTKYSNHEDMVNLIISDGNVDIGFAYDGRVGIAPAVLLDGDNVYVYEDENNEDVYIMDFGISFTTRPKDTRFLAKKINMFVNYSPLNADIIVEVANTNDDPSWEDATDEFLNGDLYTFLNTDESSSAETWGVMMRVTIRSIDGAPLVCNSYGFTFS